MSKPPRGEKDAPPSPRSILERRLVIVTGKGGTGKTSVVAALALAAASRGRRVIVVETGRDEHVPRLLGAGEAPVGYGGRELGPGLRAMCIEPYQALAEYLHLQLGVGPLVSRVLRNRAFHQLLDASPGWRELITLGKVWHLGQLRDGSERPQFDLILVDAPATGHGLTFLDVPRVVVSAVRAGPLRRHATWVEAMVKDADQTLLLPVSLAEELPARETTELVERVRKEVGIRVDRVVVNAVLPPPFPARVPDLDERLARLRLPRGVPGLPPPRIVAACATYLRSRHELHREYVEKIGSWTGLPTVCLPYLPAGVRGPADLEPLGSALLGSALLGEGT